MQVCTFKAAFRVAVEQQRVAARLSDRESKKDVKHVVLDRLSGREGHSPGGRMVGQHEEYLHMATLDEEEVLHLTTLIKHHRLGRVRLFCHNNSQALYLSRGHPLEQGYLQMAGYNATHR